MLDYLPGCRTSQGMNSILVSFRATGASKKGGQFRSRAQNLAFCITGMQVQHTGEKGIEIRPTALLDAPYSFEDGAVQIRNTLTDLSSESHLEERTGTSPHNPGHPWTSHCRLRRSLTPRSCFVQQLYERRLAGPGLCSFHRSPQHLGSILHSLAIVDIDAILLAEPIATWKLARQSQWSARLARGQESA